MKTKVYIATSSGGIAFTVPYTDNNYKALVSLATLAKATGATTYMTFAGSFSTSACATFSVRTDLTYFAIE